MYLLVWCQASSSLIKTTFKSLFTFLVPDLFLIASVYSHLCSIPSLTHYTLCLTCILANALPSALIEILQTITSELRLLKQDRLMPWTHSKRSVGSEQGTNNTYPCQLVSGVEG
jgi:hypothetical protein